MYRLHPYTCFQEDDVMHFAPSKESLAERSRPPFDAGRKLSEIDKALLWQLLNEAPECPSRELLAKVAQRQGLVPVSVRHLNRLRVQWTLNRPKGRPRHAAGCLPVASGTEVVRIIPRLSFVGVHLFAHWLNHQGRLDTVVEQLMQAVEAHKRGHPSDDFALLQHREQTLRRRFQALLLAPLFGIDRLTAFDTHEHPLPTLLGQGYHSSTLSQFLGQLERVGAAEALLPALIPAQAGQLIYVDGHMIAYWSRVPMHKGKITMLGRIMAGSQAVIAHDEAGQALFVAYYPPDVHLSASITASATFGHSASPCNVTCWYIMALPCALKIYVKYSDNFLPPELIAFQSLQYLRHLSGVDSVIDPPKLSYLGHHLLDTNGIGHFRKQF
jgi:hypothetical protein